MKLLKDLCEREINGVTISFGGTKQSFRLNLTTPRKSEDPATEEVCGKLIITRQLTDRGAIVPLNAKEADTTTFSLIYNRKPPSTGDED